VPGHSRRKAGRDLAVVAKLLRFGEQLELFERLILELPDALAH